MSTALPDLGLRLTQCRLQVRNAQRLANFYTKVFGMTVIKKHDLRDTNDTVYLLGYAAKASDKSHDQPAESHDPSLKSPDKSDDHCYANTCLELTSTGEKTTEEEKESSSDKGTTNVNCKGKQSSYWKIGVNLYDLEFAAERLKSTGVEVTDPLMIPDVGLLCHVFDPEGYDTELMQFTFQGSVLPHTKNELSTIGQSAVFSVITVRVQDMANSLRFYQDVLGLQPVCRQDQTEEYGLDIYYLSCYKDRPPNPDLQALENIEWTYQRAYTLLELVANTKHGEQAQEYQQLLPGQQGFKGLGMGCTNMAVLKRHLNEHRIPFTERSPITNTPAIDVKDPDNIPITFIQI